MFQPPRASKSRIRSRRRAPAASRCAGSSGIWSPSRSSSATRSGATVMTGVCVSIAASLGATLHPTFRAAGDASRTALSGRAMVFAVVGLRGPSPEPHGLLGGHREHAADTRPVLSNEAVKWKMLPARKPEEPGGAIDMLAVLALL